MEDIGNNFILTFIHVIFSHGKNCVRDKFRISVFNLKITTKYYKF